jgi:hypothetical protein
MSIYVSISCLGEDKELIKTVQDCKEMAKDPDSVYFGIAVIENLEFYKKIKKDLSNIKNISFLYKEEKNNLGVAKGRNFAASMYNNEEYFLQIDPHSRFNKNWDITLIDTFNQAVETVNNKKTVLTGYLGKYLYNKDDGQIYVDDNLSYTRWIPNEFVIGDVIPKFNHAPLHSISDELNIFLQNNKFAPASLISGHFIFGNSYFGKDIHLPENLLFWEEEILQTIELISDGFSILHFGSISPIYHLYTFNIFSQEEYGRDDLQNYLPNDEENYQLMKNNFLSYLKNNDLKVKKFEKYANIDILTGAKSSSTFPDTYSNIGFLPTKK